MQPGIWLAWVTWLTVVTPLAVVTCYRASGLSLGSKVEGWGLALLNRLPNQIFAPNMFKLQTSALSQVSLPYTNPSSRKPEIPNRISYNPTTTPALCPKNPNALQLKARRCSPHTPPTPSLACVANLATHVLVVLVRVQVVLAIVFLALRKLGRLSGLVFKV